jgi:hypothetical protein
VCRSCYHASSRRIPSLLLLMSNSKRERGGRRSAHELHNSHRQALESPISRTMVHTGCHPSANRFGCRLNKLKWVVILFFSPFGQHSRPVPSPPVAVESSTVVKAGILGSRGRVTGHDTYPPVRAQWHRHSFAPSAANFSDFREEELVHSLRYATYLAQWAHSNGTSNARKHHLSPFRTIIVYNPLAWRDWDPSTWCSLPLLCCVCETVLSPSTPNRCTWRQLLRVAACNKSCDE